MWHIKDFPEAFFYALAAGLGSIVTFLTQRATRQSRDERFHDAATNKQIQFLFDQYRTQALETETTIEMLREENKNQLIKIANVEAHVVVLQSDMRHLLAIVSDLRDLVARSGGEYHVPTNVLDDIKLRVDGAHRDLDAGVSQESPASASSAVITATAARKASKKGEPN